ncbi:hypothetical protein [Profundibacter sp.]
MKLALHLIGAASLSVLSATSAQATFSCDVLPLSEGVIELHENPDASSPVIARVPAGWNVSAMSGDDSIQGVWMKVAYSTDPDAFWGEGQIGWVLQDQLGDCG